MVKHSGAVFKPVRFEFGKIHVSGGYASKPMAMVTKTIDDTDGKKKIFAKMRASENWLVMATCGHGNKNKSSFDRTSLIEDLRERICRLCDGVDAIDGKQVDTGGEYDPMSEIGSSTDGPTGSEQLAIVAVDVKGRARYYRNRAKNCIVTVNMASRCPEVDPNCTQMRPVKLFITDRVTVWLSLDDVEWAMGYLFHQNQLKGVPLVDDSDAGPGAAFVAVVPA